MEHGNYKKGHKLEPHYHNEFSRESTITCEGIFVVKGKVKCNLYKKNKEKINSYEIEEGQIMFQFFGIHEYEIEEDSIVVEIKKWTLFWGQIRIELVSKSKFIHQVEPFFDKDDKKAITEYLDSGGWITEHFSNS